MPCFGLLSYINRARWLKLTWNIIVIFWVGRVKVGFKLTCNIIVMFEIVRDGFQI